MAGNSVPEYHPPQSRRPCKGSPHFPHPPRSPTTLQSHPCEKNSATPSPLSPLILLLAMALFVLGFSSAPLTPRHHLPPQFPTSNPPPPTSTFGSTAIPSASPCTPRKPSPAPRLPPPAGPYTTTFPFTLGFHDTDLAASHRHEFHGFCRSSNRQLDAIEYNLPLSAAGLFHQSIHLRPQLFPSSCSSLSP